MIALVVTLVVTAVVATLVGGVAGAVFVGRWLFPFRASVVSEAGQLLEELRERADELTEHAAEVASVHERLTWITDLVYEGEERLKAREARFDRALSKLAATGIVGDLREEAR